MQVYYVEYCYEADGVFSTWNRNLAPVKRLAKDSSIRMESPEPKVPDGGE